MSHQVSKQTLKHDELSESLFGAVEFLKRHTTEAAAIAAAVLIVIVGAVFIGQSRAKSEREASVILSGVNGALYSGQFEQAAQGFAEIIKRYGSSAAAKEALVNLANLEFRQGKFDEARQHYARCIKAGTPNQLVLYAAVSGLASCDEQKGDFAAAGDGYAAYARKHSKEQFLASEALLAAGRCYAAATPPLTEKARAAYRTLIDRYAQTAAGSQAKAQLAMLPPL